MLPDSSMSNIAPGYPFRGISDCGKLILLNSVSAALVTLSLK